MTMQILTALVRLTGTMPFANDSTEQTIRLLRQGSYPRHKLEIDEPPRMRISPEGRDFIAQLLQPDPARRMSLDAAVRHPWVSGDLLEQRRSGSLAEFYQSHTVAVPPTSPDFRDAGVCDTSTPGSADCMDSQPVHYYFDDEVDSSESSRDE